MSKSNTAGRPPTHSAGFPVSSLQSPVSTFHSPAFTLLELLVVIAIIMIVSSILVASYFGMMRSSSYAAAEKNIFNALTLARQRACIDGTRVYLMFTNSTDFVLVRSAGRITKANLSALPQYLYDAYADLSNAEGTNRSVRIYNMDSNGVATVTEFSLSVISGAPNANDPVTGEPYRRPEWRFTVTDLSPTRCFSVGDRYGIEVYQMQRLPKGFYCKVGRHGGTEEVVNPVANNNKVIFESDGSRNVDSIDKIVVFEKIAEGNTANRVTFKIDPSGKITIVPVS